MSCIAESDARINHPLLLQHFAEVADAPDAIPRLRRFILDLAVRGKLVPQDPNDEPASELLKRIAAERERLVKEKKIKQPKALPAIDADEVPFDLPSGWEWVRTRQITVDRGQTKPTGDFTYLDVSSINKEVGIIGEPEVISAESAPSRARKIVAEGDVIYSCVRPYLLNIAVVDREITPQPIASTAFSILNTMGLSEPRLLWICLRSATVIEQVETLMRGQAYPAINDSDFSKVIIPLPPLAEQKRIVAKVDELMALCDDLEAAQQERETQRDRLVAATHHQLNDANADPREAATFALSTFHLHTRRPADIAALRQTILNLAVRGKLVEQDPNDEPASELLKRIAAEKERLVKEGKIKKPKALLAIHGVDFPHLIPESWKWIRFGEIILDSDAGWSPKTETFPRTGDSWGVLKVSAVSWGRFQPDKNKQLLPNVEPRLSAVAKLGDFLISRANTSELVAKAVVVKEAPDKLLLSDKIVRLKFSDCVSKNYAALVNNSAAHIREHYVSKASGTSPSMKNVSRDVIYQVLIPLPPLAEQKRIVAKVDELMALCDQLEAQLTTTQTESQQLLEACLREAVA